MKILIQRLQTIIIITQINNKNIDFKNGIIDNQITGINSTLNDLKTKNNNSKYSIENFFIYNIEIENTYTLNSDNLQFSIFNYDLGDDFKKRFYIRNKC